MLTVTQAIILGIFQGITELFPISSLGHSVILPSLLNWHINQNSSSFLDFLVATHFATALVLFMIYRKDWMAIISGIIRTIKNRKINENDINEKLGWLLIIATVPAGLVGVIFEKKIQGLFASSSEAAIFLILNGIMLLFAEGLRKKKMIEESLVKSDSRISKISFMQSFKVGLSQLLALLPGFSRTGATLSGGLLSGLSHEDAVKFSFLLATPIIGGAALLKLPHILGKAERGNLHQILIGAAMAGIFAYLSNKFLVKYFKTNKLTPFGIYCIIAGGISLVIFLLR